jgi:transcriptional regulator with XRE-family HTH domain
MSDKHKSELPFGPLGRRLKRMRVSRQESLAEVSGAVEIDPDQLTSIETGVLRPNEEILLLLISHFNLKDEEADKLWKLAGYEQQTDTAASVSEPPAAFALNPEDLKIVYTDMIHISVNYYGVVMNFMQSSGTQTQPLAISRVGMSREHAESMLKLLQQSLELKQKQLPPSRKQTKDSD